jgi:hypothetical protein
LAALRRAFPFEASYHLPGHLREGLIGACKPLEYRPLDTNICVDTCALPFGFRRFELLEKTIHSFDLLVNQKESGSPFFHEV